MYFISKAYTNGKKYVNQFVNRSAAFQILTDGEYRAMLSSLLIIRVLRSPRFDFIKEQLNAAKD